MRKLSKKISMLMVLAMLVGMFSGIVSASAASAWSFKSKNYNVAVDGTIVMGNKEYADFDLLKDGKAPTGYTVKWASSDENVVWVNAKTGQLRANKLGMANVGDKAVISATFTNTATKKSATRSFVIAYGEQEYELVTKVGDVVLGEETLLVGESYKLATTVLDEAGNSVDFKTCKLYRNYFIDGKAIANPYVPEKAGEVTITVAAFAKKADMDDLSKAVKNVKPVEYKVTATTGEFAAEADSIYTFKVTGKFAKDANFTVVKDGNRKVAVKSEKVAEDGASAVITMTNKLTKGIYTITCDEQKVDVDVDDEKAVEIKIYEADSEVYTTSAVVGSGKKDAVLVHYDVFNQYGDSIRKNCTIEWSSNAVEVSDNKNLGILKLKKDTSGTEFRYGDLIVLNAVALNNGKAPINVTANMKVALDHAASSVEVVGVVKNDSTKILQEIPANFVGGDYYLVFKMFDRAGFEMDYDPTYAQADFAFTTMNPLLIADVKDGSDITNIYIDGLNYGKMEIEPGLQVKFGGYADIKAISNKTGKESVYSLRVVSDQILQEFVILDPNGISARNKSDGNVYSTTLDYLAYDEEGDLITDFRALYKAVGFSSDDFKLVEDNTGKAVLNYALDPDAVTPEKSYDAPVIVTTIVYTGAGSSTTKQLNIKVDRIASEVKEYVGATTVLEGNDLDLKFVNNDPNKLVFLDQYGDTLGSAKLFRSTKETTVDGSGNTIIDYGTATAKLFEHRYVGVKVKDTTAGGKFWIQSAATGTTTDKTGATVSTLDGYTLFDPFVSNDLKFRTGMNFTESVEEFPVEFVLYDAKKKEFVGGSELVVTFKVADLSQVVAFSVGLNDGFVKDGNDKSVTVGDPWGGKGYVNGTLRDGSSVKVRDFGIASVSGTPVIMLEYKLKDYDFKAEATGIPEIESSSTVANGVVSGASTTVLPKNLSILADTTNVKNDLLYKDQSQRTPDGWFKDRNLVYDVKATVYSYGTEADGSNKFRGTASTTLQIGNVDRKYVRFDFAETWAKPWITWNTEAYVKAEKGIITYQNLRDYIKKAIDNYDDAKGDYMTADDTITITLTKYVESDNGLRQPNYEMRQAIAKANDPKGMIINAEIGDKFLATYTVEGHPVTHTISFTVGSDNTAKFSNNNDTCNWR